MYLLSGRPPSHSAQNAVEQTPADVRYVADVDDPRDWRRHVEYDNSGDIGDLEHA